MLAGEVVNRSESRAALHPLLRDFGGSACRQAPEAAGSPCSRRARGCAQWPSSCTRARCVEALERASRTSSTSASADPSSARACCATRCRTWPRQILRVHFVSNLDALQITRLLEEAESRVDAVRRVEQELQHRRDPAERAHAAAVVRRLRPEESRTTGSRSPPRPRPPSRSASPRPMCSTFPSGSAGASAPGARSGCRRPCCLGWPVYRAVVARRRRRRRALRHGAGAREPAHAARARQRLALDVPRLPDALHRRLRRPPRGVHHLGAAARDGEQRQVGQRGRRGTRLRHRAGRVGRARQQRAAHVLPVAARRHHAQGRHLDRLQDRVQRIRGPCGRTERPSQRPGRRAEPARVDARLQLGRHADARRPRPLPPRRTDGDVRARDRVLPGGCGASTRSTSPGCELGKKLAAQLQRKAG